MAGKKQNGLSPMMEQYFDIKSKYPDMLLFFRLGDFYEMFLMTPKSPPKSWILSLRAGTAARRSGRLCAACRFTRRTTISQSL